MGKQLKRYLALASAIILSAGFTGNPVQISATEIDSQLSEARLEAVNENMPDLSVYCYLSDELQKLPAEDIGITYGKEKITTTEIKPFAETGQGINYYLLVDKSGSITPAYFERIKEAVQEFQQGIGQDDRMTLIGFGDAVDVIFQDAAAAEDCTAAIQSLTTGDNNTLLFDAIKKTAQLSDKASQPDNRKIGIVITDGEDFSENTSTSKEALTALQKTGLPMYVMAVQDTIHGAGNPYIDATGEFARSSGGILRTFGEQEAGTCLMGLKDLITSAYTITGQAKTNRLNYELQQMTVSFGDKVRESIDIVTDRNKEDHTAPEASAEETGTNRITISFSERVQNADNVGNYKVLCDGEKVLTDYTVTYTEKDKPQAELNFEKLMNGSYEITFQNICDDSQEENALKSKCKLEVTDGETESIWEHYGVFLIGGAILVIVLAVILILYIRIRKRSAVVTVEDKLVFKDQVEKKHHIEVRQVDEKAGATIIFEVEGATRPIVADVRNSLIVGRSEICDVYMNDEKMSRQHFVIYEEPDGFYIEDLQTTNGTWLNGERLYTKKKLQKGDKIKAGKMKILVRW